MDATITWDTLTDLQQIVLKQGETGHAFTIGVWEEDRLRAASLLVEAGLLIYGGVDRFNGRTHSYSVTVVGRAIILQQRSPQPDVVANVGISGFTTDQQLRINAALVTHFYDRSRRLMIELESQKGLGDHYGTKVMNDEDRLFNRVMANLIMSDLGIPEHDIDSLDWLKSVLNSAS